MTNSDTKLIAFYLPQFHPIPENDEWWGKGFTEWTNVARAKPLFPGHYQPHLPADLGFYDLRVSETRSAQAELAKKYGVYGFSYWHYWFGRGKRLLERPITEVIKSGSPDLPFCFSWANETWSGIWHGSPNRILMEQEYPGKEDDLKHFLELLPAFSDKRYIKIDNKPLFIILRPKKVPHLKEFIDLWNEMAVKNGLAGMFFLLIKSDIHENINIKECGADGVINTSNLKNAVMNLRSNNLVRGLNYLMKRPYDVFEYKEAVKYMIEDNRKNPDYYPTIYTNWDNSPRCGVRGTILKNPDPSFLEEYLSASIDHVGSFSQKMVFMKSWNEWAEGNYIEPDTKYGLRYLETIKNVIDRTSRITSK